MYKTSLYTRDELNNELTQLYSLLHSIEYCIQISTKQLLTTPYKDYYKYTDISQNLKTSYTDLKYVQDTITYFELQLQLYERAVHNTGNRYCPM